MALITNIQRFCTHDGEGIRTTVFFKGCPLKCAWCHNPETICVNNEIMFDPDSCIFCGMCGKVCGTKSHVFDGGHKYIKDTCINCMKCAEVCPSKAIESVAREMTVDGVLHEVLKDKVFFGEKGGITLSGGEPLLHPGFAIELLRKSKEAGITTCVETCGFFNSAIIPELIEVTDMFLFDLKDGNSERHARYTGVDTDKILHNLYEIDKYDVTVILRCIMVKGVNTDKSRLDFTADVFKSLKHARGVGLLPYHAYGGSKNSKLGYSDNGKTEWIPEDCDIGFAKEYLVNKGVNII